MEAKPCCSKCKPGSKPCDECEQWEVSNKKTKLPVDVKKQTTKEATIGSLMNTMGRVGGNQKKMKPMAVSAGDLSSKPLPSKQLGEQTNNRFINQSAALQPISGQKLASSFDVSPYLSSTYINFLSYKNTSKNSHLYTKLASLESMLTKTLPGIFKAMPSSVKEPISQATRSIKEKFTPAVQSTAFADAAGKMNQLLSGLGDKLRALPKPTHSGTVSRASMLGASKAPALDNIKNTKAIGDVPKTKYDEIAKAGPSAPPALPKYPYHKFTSSKQLIEHNRAADLQGRYNQSGLGSDVGPLAPEELTKRLVGHINKYSPGDLVGLPAQHRAAYDKLPDYAKDTIGKALANNAQTSAALKLDAPESVFGSHDVDSGIMSAGDTINRMTNIPRSVGALVGLNSKDKLVSNIGQVRDVISINKRISDIQERIRALGNSKTPEAVQARTALVSEKMSLEKYIATGIDLNSADPMTLYNPNLGLLDKGLGTFGEAVTTFMPATNAVTAAAQVGLNTRGVENADLYADLLGLFTPSPAGVAKAYGAVKSLKGMSKAEMVKALSDARAKAMNNKLDTGLKIMSSRPL